jgi:hypothetical protein
MVVTMDPDASRAAKRRRIGVGLVVLAAALAFVLFVPKVFIPGSGNSQLKRENELRIALVQAIGLLGLGLTAFVGWRTLQVTREGQITDRYTRAVELLGAEEPDVRLGGIYALERIAQDSERDHGTIMEVLCAYARVHSSTTRQDRVHVDVQAALTVLGRRCVKRDAKEFVPYLNRVRLPQARLRGVNLERGRIRDADLRGALLTGAHLADAHFARTKLDRAHLKNARLERAILTDACLRGAELQGAVLTGATLDGADLTGALYDLKTIPPRPDFDFEAAGAELCKDAKEPAP